MASTTHLEKTTWLPGGNRLIFLSTVLLMIPIVAAFAFATIQPIQVLPRISLAPGYAFVDQDGGRLTNEDMRGKLVLYHFTYTGCGERCASQEEVMRGAQEIAKDVGAEGIPVELVTISFDPESDTPEQLRSYAESLNADTSLWHFVTGEPNRLKNVIGGGFRSYYNQDESGSFEFDPTFVLVDGWGIIRAKYKSGSPDLDTIRRDIGMITTEANNSEGASRIAYEAAHLFLCYPD